MTRLKEIRVGDGTKEKCSLSEKKMLGLQRRTKEDIKTFVPHLTRLIWTFSDAPSLTVRG